MGLLLGSCMVGGCAEPEDDLDGDVVAQLGRTVGDAEGPDGSGRYRWGFSQAECGCSGLPAGGQLTLCSSLLTDGPPGPPTADLDVWVADGQLQLTVDLSTNAPMAGPLQSDGSASAGAVSRLDTLVATGEVITRFDGVFERPGAPESGAGSVLVEGELQQRLVLDAVVGDSTTNVDCRERLTVSGAILVER